jgi:hypothetical protein
MKNQNKGDNMKTKEHLMKKLAELTELQFDGGDDTRMFYDQDRINVNASIMTEAEYIKMEKTMNKINKKGKGYSVYVWNDSSGYKYWKKQGESRDYNYIQVTADITDLNVVDHEQLKKDVQNVFDKLYKYENVFN